MSYNSALDELFLADRANNVVRVSHLRDGPCDLRDVYNVPNCNVLGVCHMRHSDTLLVCCSEQNKGWLVALSRIRSEWREAQREMTDPPVWAMISCELSDSRALVGEYNSKYMELFRVESGPHIARVRRIHVPEEFRCFAATFEKVTLVAMSYDSDVVLNSLNDDRLEELSRITLRDPYHLLWLSDRLLAVGDAEKSVTEIQVTDLGLERRRQLFSPDNGFRFWSWCAVDGGLAFFDWKSKDILRYKF